MKETERPTSDLTSQEQLSAVPPSKKHWRFWGWALSPARETALARSPLHSFLAQWLPTVGLITETATVVMVAGQKVCRPWGPAGADASRSYRAGGPGKTLTRGTEVGGPRTPVRTCNEPPSTEGRRPHPTPLPPYLAGSPSEPLGSTGWAGPRTLNPGPAGCALGPRRCCRE